MCWSGHVTFQEEQLIRHKHNMYQFNTADNKHSGLKPDHSKMIILHLLYDFGIS